MKLLSRKVLASLLVFITATLFVWYAKIPGDEWVKLAIVTVMAYVAGDGIGAVVKYLQTTRVKKVGEPLTVTSIQGKAFPITLSQRLKNLLDAKFIAAIAVYAVATFLMWNGKISVIDWNYVAMGTILGYDLMNPIGKV